MALLVLESGVISPVPVSHSSASISFGSLPGRLDVIVLRCLAWPVTDDGHLWMLPQAASLDSSPNLSFF